jgi:two-component system response regulator PilR (NtrC family)
MQQVRGMIDRLAKSQAPVFINGESGSGKELAARMIHLKGPRADLPFIAVNCGAIPENLMESEFFGYKKGAFTGAEADRDGFFQAATGGTLFLDEVADLPLAMQVKLLRAIQEKKVRKVGSTTEDAVDTRLISATHKNLSALVENGEFRQDLYYRLHVIELSMPSLREMREDIPLIATAILTRLARGNAAGLEPEAVAALERYPFPGNVRELENLLHRAVALSGGETIDVYDLGLPESVFTDSAAQELDLITENTRGDVLQAVRELPPMVPIEEPLPDDLEGHLDAVERDILVRALERHRFNRTAAGASLGLSLRQMRYRMARLGVNVGGDGSERE